MEWFIAAIAVLALGVAAVVAAGGMGQMERDPVRDTYAATLPDEPLSADDVRRLRFGVGLRGYAMDQVDAVLDRLAAEIDARDARIAELSGGSALPEPLPERAELGGWSEPVAYAPTATTQPTFTESDPTPPGARG